MTKPTPEEIIKQVITALRNTSSFAIIDASLWVKALTDAGYIIEKREDIERLGQMIDEATKIRLENQRKLDVIMARLEAGPINDELRILLDRYKTIRPSMLKDTGS